MCVPYSKPVLRGSLRMCVGICCSCLCGYGKYKSMFIFNCRFSQTTLMLSKKQTIIAQLILDANRYE